MSEEGILIIVFGVLGYIASFLFGYYLCEFRRLATYNSSIDRSQGITESIGDTTESAESSITGAKSRIDEAIERLQQYGKPVEQDQDDELYSNR